MRVVPKLSGIQATYMPVGPKALDKYSRTSFSLTAAVTTVVAADAATVGGAWPLRRQGQSI